MEDLNVIDPTIANALDEHLNNVKSLILIRLSELDTSTGMYNDDDVRKRSEKGALRINNLNQAILQYIPLGLTEKKDRRAWPFFDLFPPFTIICFIMTLMFGWFGLNTKGQSGTSYLDIAKIFAGALVGSTTTNVASQLRSKPR